jgi:HEAT repeat protein
MTPTVGGTALYGVVKDMKTYREYVDLLRVPEERLEAMRILAGGSLNARESRGRKLAPEAIAAVVGGLDDESPVVRRCCLEILDGHPDPTAVPGLLKRLDDPVPRVRWHAVHALACDACKAGDSYLNRQVYRRLRQLAENDSNKRVREYARWELGKVGA